MGKLDSISIEKLIDEVGMYIKSEEFKIIFRQNEEAVATAQYMIKRYGVDPKFSYDNMNNGIKRLLCTTDSFVDKEAFALLTLYNTGLELEKKGKRLDDKKRKAIKQRMSNAMRLLKGTNKRIVYLKENSEEASEVMVLDSEELVKAIRGNRKLGTLNEPNKEQSERINAINQDVGDMVSIIGLLALEDIENIIARDKLIGSYIVGQATRNTLRLIKSNNPDKDLNEMLEKEPEELQDILENSYYHETAISEAIISNCKYIDIDKMLLVLGFRIIEDLENGTALIRDEEGNEVYDGTQAEGIEYLRSVILYFISHIKKGTAIDIPIMVQMKDTEISSRAEVKDRNEQSDEDTICYTLEDLKEDTARISNGKYFKRQNIMDMKRGLVEGEILLEEVPPDMRGVFVFGNEEYDKIVLVDSRNLAFLICEESFDNSKSYRYLEQMANIPDNVLEALRDKEIFNKEKNMQFFEEGKITLYQMIAFALCDNTDENYISTRIRDIYCKMNTMDKDEEEYNKFLVLFNNYASLYRSVFLIGKDEEEINSRGFHLVELFEDNLSDELLQILYQNGLITIQVAGDWGMDLTEMLSKNQLRPNDLKKLYLAGNVSLDQIKAVLIHGDMQIDEKEDLVYSTFDGDTEEEVQIREELMQLLSLGEEYKVDKNKRGVSRIKSAGSKNVKKEFVTDPQARWKFISLIDKDYSKKFLPEGKEVIDGHRLFLLLNKNEIIIEKMREMKRGKMVGAYGSATYILGIQDFFDNIDEIIINGSINRSFLRELVERDQALKIIHSKNWHKSVMKHYGIFESNERYEEIYEAGERVERSRRERT